MDRSIISVTCFLGIASIWPATYFSCTFLFWRILSLTPIGLPRFRCGSNSFVAVLIDCPTGTSIRAGMLAVGMWDFTILLLSVNTSGNWFTIPCKWIIFWTSSSHWFVQRSKFDNVETFQLISCHASGNDFSPPNGGKIVLLKWQSSKHA